MLAARSGRSPEDELAAALAYRLFLWFLPFVLVLVAGLGVYADASDQTPREVADRLGLAGLVVHSVAAAATSSARWYALLIGVPILLYLTRSLLRTVVAVHRLAWGLEPRRGHLTSANVLLFLLAVVASLAVAAFVSASVGASTMVLGRGRPAGRARPRRDLARSLAAGCHARDRRVADAASRAPSSSGSASWP